MLTTRLMFWEWTGPNGSRKNITSDDENGWGRVGKHLEARDTLTDGWTVPALASPAVVLTPSHTGHDPVNHFMTAQADCSSAAALTKSDPPWLGWFLSTRVLE